MTSHFRPVWSVATARAVDAESTAKHGIPTDKLMEQAGEHIAAYVARRVRANRRCAVLALAGPGNNGGDGLVAARLLLKKFRIRATVFVVGKREGAEQGDSLFEVNLKRLEKAGGSWSHWSQDDFCQFKDRVKSSRVIVIDAIFGSGFRPPLAGEFASALRAVTEIKNRYVLAVDVPSGLPGDGGAAEVPLVADATITFGSRKYAHVMSPARDFCGRVLVRSIGFHRQTMQQAPLCAVLARPRAFLASHPWDILPPSANKYERGHVLVIGGSVGKLGAPVLAGLAALRSGAGWVSVALPPEALNDSPPAAFPLDLTCENLFDASGCLSPDKLRDFIDQRKVRAVILGPGWVSQGLQGASLKVLAKFAIERSLRIVLDAGATSGILKLLEQSEVVLPRGTLALVPHPGEWTRLGLSGKNTAPLSVSDLESVRCNLKPWHTRGIGFLFKGATPTWFDSDDGIPPIVSSSGCVALARAGSGDVFAGILGAHFALAPGSLTAAESVTRSLNLLAAASSLAQVEFGMHGVLATDMISQIARAQIS